MHPGRGFAGATRESIPSGQDWQEKAEGKIRVSPYCADCVHAHLILCEEGRSEIGDVVALAVGRMRANL